jgi:hypothetical protein
MTSLSPRALPPCLQKLALTGRNAADEVQAVASYLAELMRDIHGGDWRIQIEHEHELIVIASRPRKAVEGGR